MPCIDPIHSADPSSRSFAESFFAPLVDALAKAAHGRSCPELSDGDWLRLGVRRALDAFLSGRAFLQHLAAAGEDPPEVSHFFESLKSARRLDLVREVSVAVAAGLPPLPGDAWDHVPELEKFDLFAGDGHFHAAAAHDPRIARSGDEGGTKYAVGHFFALDLRSHGLVHLTAADEAARRKEHDMRALKRLDLEMLRQGARKGRKVLYVWDCPSLRSRPAVVRFACRVVAVARRSEQASTSASGTTGNTREACIL